MEKAELGAEWQEHGLVFPSEVGTPLSPRNLQRHFKGVLAKAGLPETIRFHDLCHSCATVLIAQGVHPRVVMALLGHSQISVTMNTYAHVLTDTQREAAAKLDALIGGTQAQSEQGATKDDPQGEVAGDDHESDQASGKSDETGEDAQRTKG